MSEYKKLSPERLAEIQAVYDSPEQAAWRVKRRADMPNSSAAHFCDLWEHYQAQEAGLASHIKLLNENEVSITLLEKSRDKLDQELAEARAEANKNRQFFLGEANAHEHSRVELSKELYEANAKATELERDKVNLLKELESRKKSDWADVEELQTAHARIAELEDTMRDLHQLVPNALGYTDPATTLLQVGAYIGRLQGRIMGLEAISPKHCGTCGHLEELHTKAAPERFCLLNLTSNCACKKYEATTTPTPTPTPTEGD